MTDIAQMLFNPYVVAYLAIIGAVQGGYLLLRRWRAAAIGRRRTVAGLPDAVLMDHADRLEAQRRQALIGSGLLLLTLFGAPVLIIGLARCRGWDVSTQQESGLAGVFLALLIWLLYSGTDVARSSLGGLAFRTLVSFKRPFQLGDRVTLKGVSGKVVGLDSFFVQLNTVNDDLISLPTHTLWGEVLTSANAGDRSSLCVMAFHLSPRVSPEQRQQAEDAIWEAIQASVFYAPAKPMQIYLAQTPWSIQLTAKAYVASTYDEALFTSDVTQAFLDFMAQRGIALATAPALVSDD